jgi:hypothetical protein
MHLRSVVSVAMIGLGLVACSAERSSTEEEAPSAALDTLDPADEGASYNGWTQTPSGMVYMYMGFGQLDHTFSRAGGEATRGGGACFVYQQPGSSCSSDSPCLSAAQAAFGASAYGYCYSGVCYSRPGSQTDYCALNPNRAPGSVTKLWPSYGVNYYEHILGCMTKTGGPNTACGGTNTSLYMRYVVPAAISTANP